MDSSTSDRRHLIIVGYIRQLRRQSLRNRIIPKEIYNICMQYYLADLPCILSTGIYIANRHTKYFNLIDCNTNTAYRITGLQPQNCFCVIPKIPAYMRVPSDGDCDGGTVYQGIFSLDRLQLALYSYSPNTDTINIAHTFISSIKPYTAHCGPELIYCISSQLIVYAKSKGLYALNVRDIKYIESDIHKFKEIETRNNIPNHFGKSKRSIWRITYLSNVDCLFIVAYAESNIRSNYGRGYCRAERKYECQIFNLGTRRWRRQQVAPLTCLMDFRKIMNTISMCSNGTDVVYVLCWEYQYFGDMILQSYNTRKNKWSVLCDYRNFKMEEPGIIWYDETQGIKLLTKGGTLYVWDLRAKRKRWVQVDKAELSALCDENVYHR